MRIARMARTGVGMFVAVVIAAVTFGSSAQAIIGGVDVFEDETRQILSSVVHLNINISESKGAGCTGTYIGDRWVLTAAHCLVYKDDQGRFRRSKPSSVMVRAGSLRSDSGGVVIGAQNVYTHDGYDPRINLKNDIALVELDSDAGLAEAGVRAANLANANWNYNVGNGGMMAGWGQVEGGVTSPNLRWTGMRLLEQEDCVSATSYSDSRAAKAKIAKLMESMVCAGSSDSEKRGSAPGDSGGPLLTQISGVPTIFAVTKGTVAVDNNPNPNEATLLVRVADYLEWIESVKVGATESVQGEVVGRTPTQELSRGLLVEIAKVDPISVEVGILTRFTAHLFE